MARKILIEGPKFGKPVNKLHGLMRGFIIAGLVFGLVFLIASVQVFFTARVVSEDIRVYDQNINIYATSDKTVPIDLLQHPSEFVMGSFKISGEVQSGSDVKVYLDNGVKRVLVYDSVRKIGITGFAASEESKGNGGESSEGKDKKSDGWSEESPNDSGSDEESNSEEGGNEDVGESGNESNSIDDGTEDVGEEPAETTVIENISSSVSETIKVAEIFGELFEVCAKSCNMEKEGFNSLRYNLVFEVNKGAINVKKITYDLIDLGSKAVTAQADSEVQSLIASTEKARVIVELKERGNQIRSEQDAVISSMNVATKGASISAVSNEDFKVKHKYGKIGAITGEVNQKGLEKLLKNPKVKRVYLDQVLQVSLDETIPLISADDVQALIINETNVDGSGGAVCVIDTGVDYNNGAFGNRIVDQQCYCSVSGSACCPNGKQVDNDALDDNGHGTHVAGIVASNDATYKGVAPGSDIIAMKVCNNQGYCAGSDIIAGIEWCTNNASIYNISVISMSVGGTAYTGTCDTVSQAMTDAISNAASAGVIVTVSSGNNGYSDKLSWPSCVTDAVSVGAVDKNDVVASYSNRNALLDYLAPGGTGSEPVMSTVGTGFGGKYGTSMATPHVAGAVLLLKQYFKLYNGYDAEVSEIKELLNRGVDIYDSSSNLTYNRIDLGVATDNVLKINATENSVEDVDEGKVTFTTATDLTSASEAFTIRDNYIALDSSNYPQFNKAATLKLYGLSFEKTPVVFKDGEVCTSCSIDSYNEGNFTFNVVGFTNYTAEANSRLSVWDGADEGKGWYEGNALPGEKVLFFANYTAVLDNAFITSGTCEISFEDGIVNMDYNATKKIFEHSRSFSEMTDYDWNVSCSALSYETIFVAGDINVNKSMPAMTFTLDGSEENISILLEDSVVIVASLTEPADGNLSLYLNDVLIGEGNSLTNATVFESYGENVIDARYAGSDSYHPINRSLNVSVIIDSESPYWGGNISTGEGYGPTHRLNLSWIDNIGIEKAWVEHNFNGDFENVTMDVNGSEYYAEFDGDIALGSYSIRFYANDSSGNINSTSLLGYSIVRGQNKVYLSINGMVNQNVTLSYGEINVTASSDGGNVSLYKDGSLITSPEVSTPQVSNYTYSVNASGNENYYDNASGVNYTLTLNKATSEVKLTLNNNRENINRMSGKNVDIVATLITPSSGSVEIHADGSVIEEGSSPVTKSTSFSSDTTVTAIYRGNVNYLSDAEAFSINILSDSPPPVEEEEESTGGTLGGAAEYVPAVTTQACGESWTCTAWETCLEGVERRSCNDQNNCGTKANEPQSIRPCGSGCIANWQCSEWNACEEGIQKRSCKDLNLCGGQDKFEEKECNALLAAIPGIEKVQEIDLSKVKEFIMEKKALFIGMGVVLLASIGFLGYEFFFVRKISLEKLKSGLVEVKTRIDRIKSRIKQ